MRDVVGKLARLLEAQIQLERLSQMRVADLQRRIEQNGRDRTIAERAAETSPWAMMLPQLHLRHVQRLLEEGSALKIDLEQAFLDWRRERKKSDILRDRLASARGARDRQADMAAILENIGRLPRGA